MSDLSDHSEPIETEAQRLSRAGRAALARLQANEEAGDILRRLKERLAAYKRGKTDLSAPAVPAADLHLMANRYRGHGGKIAGIIAEIDAELQDAMPGRVAPVRRRLA